jgi:plastocyanin
MRRTLAFILVSLAACGGGPATDASGTCDAPIHGCSTFTDLTGGTATILVGAAGSLVYDPRCALVKVGQPVTFQGDLGFHPLAQDCGPAGAIPETAGGTTVTFSIGAAGTYGYRCVNHHQLGMDGAIQVVP